MTECQRCGKQLTDTGVTHHIDGQYHNTTGAAYIFDGQHLNTFCDACAPSTDEHTMQQLRAANDAKLFMAAHREIQMMSQLGPETYFANKGIT